MGYVLRVLLLTTSLVSEMVELPCCFCWLPAAGWLVLALVCSCCSSCYCCYVDAAVFVAAAVGWSDYLADSAMLKAYCTNSISPFISNPMVKQEPPTAIS